MGSEARASTQNLRSPTPKPRSQRPKPAAKAKNKKTEHCSTKASQETCGLVSLALVAALACLAVLGVLCVVRLTMRSPSSKRPSARAQRAGECPRRESQVLLGRGYVCSCFSCVGCGPSSSCNALRSLRKRRMVLLLLPWLRLLLVLQCLAFSASPASRSMIARFMSREQSTSEHSTAEHSRAQLPGLQEATLRPQAARTAPRSHFHHVWHGFG